MKRTEKCDTYWLHWSMGPKFSMTMPNHVTQPKLQKLSKLGYRVLPYLPYSPDLSSIDYHVIKHLDNFLQGKCFHNQQEAYNAF